MKASVNWVTGIHCICHILYLCDHQSFNTKHSQLSIARSRKQWSRSLQVTLASLWPHSVSCLSRCEMLISVWRSMRFKLDVTFLIMRWTCINWCGNLFNQFHIWVKADLSRYYCELSSSSWRGQANNFDAASLVVFWTIYKLMQ